MADAPAPDPSPWDRDDARQTRVTDGCVFCKHDPADWEAGVRAVALDTGEVICSRCLEDCRGYKRHQRLLIVVSGEFAPTVRALVRDHLARLADTVAARFDHDPRMFRLPDVANDATTADEPLDGDGGQ